MPSKVRMPSLFQSTRSARSATYSSAEAVRLSGFQSTRSARSATRAHTGGALYNLISIHALREERDPLFRDKVSQPPAISIHALREERDADAALTGAGVAKISIHALREERDGPPRAR